MRRLLPLAVCLLLAPLSSAAGPQPVSAALEWKDGFASGDLRHEGGAWALHQVADARLPLTEASYFLLEAPRIDVREDYQDYLETPAAEVAKNSTPGSQETTLASARLRLQEVRSEVQLLVVPRSPDAAPPMVRSVAGSARYLPVSRVHASLWSELPGLEPPNYLQRVYDGEHPALQVTTPAPPESTTVTGNFTVYVWDLDVANTASPGQSFESGVHRSRGVAPSGAAPNGAVHEARRQLLTLSVHDGRLSFLIPQRPLDYFYALDGTRLDTAGTWDLTSARGDVAWSDGRRSDVRDVTLHLEGRFTARLEAFTEEGTLRSTWVGHAEAVSAGAIPLGGPGPTVRAAPRGELYWLLPLGILAGGAGVAWVGVRRQWWTRDRSLRSELARPIEAAQYEAALGRAERALRKGPADPDAVMARHIALLKLDRAREVVDSLEPDYDEEAPEAAVHAYVLSLAHLRLGDAAAGARWIRRAIELYPEFASEIAANEAFAPIRSDPNIRSFLSDDGEAAGYA